MNIVIWILLTLFAMKLIWNLGVPYVLIRKPLNTKTGKSLGISVSLEMEVLLLLLAIIFAWFSKGSMWINRPITVFGFGVAAILVSYLHFLIVATIGGWFVSRKSGKSL